MSSFKEMRLPLEISAWMIGGPMWNTRVFQVQNGVESRLGLWDYPLHKWNIGSGLREVSMAAATKRFQIRARGKLYGFRVLDPFDYQVAPSEGVLVPTGVTGYWQLCKRYAEDGDVFLRKILKPIPGTVVVTKNGAVVPDPVNYTNGQAGFSSASGDVLAWSGLFDTPVRFEADLLEIGQDPAGLLNWNSANILEIRKPGTSIGTPPGLLNAAQMGLSTDTVDSGSPAPTPPPAPTPATTILISGPTGGTVGHASRPFDITVDGTLAAPVTVTLRGFGGSGLEGTWAPATVTIDSNFDVKQATYTAASTGNKTLTRVNDGGLGNGYNLSFAAVPYPAALTASPSSLTATPGVQSDPITVGSNAPLDAATTVTPHTTGSGGSFTPTSAVIGPGHSDTAAFRRTAAATGTESITFTNDQGLTNAAAVSLVVTTPPTALALTPSSMSVAAGALSDEFTVTLDQPATATIVVTLHTTGSGGGFISSSTPVTALTFIPGDTVKTFRRNGATAAGTETISLTNDVGLANGNTSTLTVTAAAPPPAPDPADPVELNGNGDAFSFDAVSGEERIFYVLVPQGEQGAIFRFGGGNSGVDFIWRIAINVVPDATSPADFEGEQVGKTTTEETVSTYAASDDGAVVGLAVCYVRALATFSGGLISAEVYT